MMINKYLIILSADTVKTRVWEPTFFQVWQNRFLYLGVVIGNLG